MSDKTNFCMNNVHCRTYKMSDSDNQYELRTEAHKKSLDEYGVRRRAEVIKTMNGYDYWCDLFPPNKYSHILPAVCQNLELSCYNIVDVHKKFFAAFPKTCIYNAMLVVMKSKHFIKSKRNQCLSSNYNSCWQINFGTNSCSRIATSESKIETHILNQDYMFKDRKPYYAYKFVRDRNR